MKLLFDENLSPRLPILLDDFFPQSVHVDRVGLGSAPDSSVWEYAKANGYHIVSKDSDFHESSLLNGSPKVVWIKRGDCSTRQGETLLRTAGGYPGEVKPSGLARELLADLNGQLRALDERIANYDARVKAACATDERSAKLAELPGIGPLTATALTAAVHDGKAFDNGRQMAASLGLTPREHSSGGKQRLMGITKRGNTYTQSFLFAIHRPHLANRVESIYTLAYTRTYAACNSSRGTRRSVSSSIGRLLRYSRSARLMAV